MTSRAALVLTTSTLHRERGATGGHVLQRQVEQLVATGHDPVVLLGDGRIGGAVSTRSASEAATRLRAADRVTVIGHGTATMPAVLEQVTATGALATRAAGRGWERIDAEEDWAGVLSCPAALVCDTLDTLGDWDAQATILRRAVQAGVPRLRLADGSVVHGFDEDGWHRLRSQERDRRLAEAPPLLGPRLQVAVDRGAVWLERRWRWAGRAGAVLLLVLCAGVAGAAAAGSTWLVAAGLAILPVVSGLCVALRRVEGRVAWPLALLAVGTVVVVPPLLGQAAGAGGMLTLATLPATLAGLLALALSGRPGSALRMDALSWLLAVGLVTVGALPAVLLVASALLVLALSGRAARGRLRRLTRLWAD